MTLAIPTGDGYELIPLAQAVSVMEAVKRLRAAGVENVIWHWNACRCCISVHEVGAHCPGVGYVIGRDGGTDYYEDGTVTLAVDHEDTP
jgi:hypothetical protein